MSHFLKIIFTSFFLLQGVVFAQNKTDLMALGDNAYYDGDFYTAAIWYKKILIQDSLDLDVRYKFAESNRQYFNLSLIHI